MAKVAEETLRVDQAENIDQVLAQLGAIIDWSVARQSRLGYFPALYRKVTLQVQEGISEGVFDDGDRMEHLDVIFANRYLKAFDQYLDGADPTSAWDFAFKVSGRWWPIVLQHLLLGMNAHINLDLGIAAARTVKADSLPGLQGDFNKINQVLASLVGGVQEELERIWAPYRILNRALGRVDSAIINFSMEKARDQAWSTALRLGPLNQADQEREITRLDAKVVLLARLVRRPGIIGSAATRVIRLGERETIPSTIEILR